MSDDGFADPGYSRVDQPRPRSAHVTTTNQSASVAGTSLRGRRSPVYAVISKPSRLSKDDNSDDVASDLGQSAGVASASVSNLYSQVNRRTQHHRRAMSNDVAFVEPRIPVDLRTMGFLSHDARFSTVGHRSSLQNYSGYASIDGDPIESSGRHSRPDSDYDTVGEPSVNAVGRLSNGFGPNYEAVVDPVARTSLVEPSSPFGVARELDASSGDDRFVSCMDADFMDPSSRSRVSPPPLLIREHIYQEVTSNRSSGNSSLTPASVSSRYGRMLSTDL